MPTISSLTLRDYSRVAIAKWYEVEKLTPRTIASQRAILDRYILPLIGDEPIYLIDNENMNLKFLIQQLLAVKPYKTRRNRIGLLRRLLLTAKRDGFLEAIPSCVERISIPNEGISKKASKSWTVAVQENISQIEVGAVAVQENVEENVDYAVYYTGHGTVTVPVHATKTTSKKKR